MKSLTTFLIIFLLFSSSSFPQDDKYKVPEEVLPLSGIHYFGAKDKFNIEVSVWGLIAKTGRFIVPKGTTLFDIISFAGGPDADNQIEEIRIVRLKNDSLNIFKDEILSFKYEDFLIEDKHLTNIKNNPELLPGDIAIFLGSKKITSREIWTFVLQITTVLISLASLTVVILRYNR